MTDSLHEEIQTLRELYQSDRDPEGRAFVPLADTLRRAGDIREAMALIRTGLEAHPDFASAHVVAARTYMDAGMLSEASNAAERVLELDQENVEALRILSLALEATGESPEARRVRRQLSELEPESEVEEDAISMDALAPDEPEEVEEDAVSMDALAPDEPEEVEEDAVSVDALAPDEPEEAEEDAVSMDALAPDEPEEAEEDAVSMDALAPDEPEEAEVDDWATVSMGDLAPDEPEEMEEDAVSLDALAPDEPEEAEEDAVSLDTLAPDEPEEAEEDAVSMDALAPDEPEEAEVDDWATVSMGDLAVDADPEEVELEAQDPDEPFVSLDEDDDGSASPFMATESDAAPDPETDDSEPVEDEPEEEQPVAEGLEEGEPRDEDAPDDEDPADELDPHEPLPTRTLADLYARQGLSERALAVYRQLLQVTPGDADLRERIAALEGGLDPDLDRASRVSGPPEASGEADPHGEEEERQDAERVRSAIGWGPDDGAAAQEVDTPFAWTRGDDSPAAGDGPAIGDYFQRMLGWGGGDDEESKDDA